MRIGVIGAGNVGGTLGHGLEQAGHEVRYGTREPGSVAEVVGWAEAVILATPWAATEAAVKSAGDFGGKPLLDATNPLGPGLKLTHGHTDSGGEQVQRWAPSAKVVKVFNTTGRENMANPRYEHGATLMLACGDDAGAVEVAVGLARDLGFEALPFGPLANARILEPFGLAWIQLAMVHKQGRGIAFGLLRR